MPHVGLLPWLLLVGWVVSGCAEVQPTGQGRIVGLQQAYFAKAGPLGGTYNDPRELAAATSEFNSEKDERVVFIAVFDGPDERRVRGTLTAPDGVTRGALRGDLPYMSKAGGGWRANSWQWSMAVFRPYPGQWKLEFWVDDVPAGTYAFTIHSPPSRR